MRHILYEDVNAFSDAIRNYYTANTQLEDYYNSAKLEIEDNIPRFLAIDEYTDYHSTIRESLGESLKYLESTIPEFKDFETLQRRSMPEYIFADDVNYNLEELYKSKFEIPKSFVDRIENLLTKSISLFEIKFPITEGIYIPGMTASHLRTIVFTFREFLDKGTNKVTLSHISKTGIAKILSKLFIKRDRSNFSFATISEKRV